MNNINSNNNEEESNVNSTFSQRLKQIRQLYESRLILQADELLKDLIKPNEVIDYEGLTNGEDFQSVEQLRFRINKEAKETRSLINDFEDYDTWTCVHKDSSIAAYYRHEDGQPLHSVKVEGLLDAPLVNVACALQEWDYYTFWAPFVESITPLEDKTHRKILHIKASKLPFFVKMLICPRDIVMLGYTSDVTTPETGARWIMSMRDAKKEDLPPGTEIPAELPGHVRASMNFAGIETNLRPDGKCFMRFMGNIDPKMPLVPNALVVFCLKCIAPYSFNMLKQATSPNESNGELMSLYAKRMKERPQLYDEITECIAKCLEREKAGLELKEPTTDLPNVASEISVGYDSASSSKS